jgi:hypothetical protein
VPEPTAHGWLRTLVEASGLSFVFFVFSLLFGGAGLREAAGTAVAVAGAPGPGGSNSLASEIAAIVFGLRVFAAALARQESGRLRRNPA